MRVLTVLTSLVIPIFALLPQAHGQGVPVHSALRGDPGPVSIAALEVNVEIEGIIAHTTLTITLHNAGQRQSEGILQFDLPAGATVSEYALDVNQTRVDGVAVEREQARSSYIQEITRRVDPGLVEHVRGNTFCARVFPIALNSERTYRIGFVSELAVAGGAAVYRVPLNWGERAATAKVNVDIAGTTQVPVVIGEMFKPLPFQQASGKAGGGRFTAAQTFNGLQLNGDLAISLSAPPAGMAAIGKGPAIVPAGAVADAPGYYFAIADAPPAMPASAPAPVEQKARHVGLCWDAGIGQDSAGLDRKLSLLKKILARCGDVDVDLIIFRESCDKPVKFLIRDGDTRALETLLGAQIYDGASRLSNLSFPRHARDLPDTAKKAADNSPDFDYWLLFSEGGCAVSVAGPAAPRTPVFAVCAGPSALRLQFQNWCIPSGGALLDLARLSDEQALDIMQQGEPVLASIECNPAEIADVSPVAARSAADRLVVTGRLLAPQATLTLHYRRGARNRAHVFALRQSDAKNSRNVARIWANHALADLTAGPTPDYPRCLRLGRLFNLVSPASSLLVLETVDQYVRHDVKPPACLPIMQSQYEDSIHAREQAARQESQQRETEIAAAWSQRTSWHDTTFSYNRNFRFVRPNVPDFSDAPDFSLNSTREKSSSGVGLFGGGGGGGGSLFSDGGSGRGAGAHARDNAAKPAPAAAVQVRLGNQDDIAQRAPGGDLVIAADPWRRDASYIEAMRRVPRKQAYSVYLLQRRTFGDSVPFYLDCADYLARYCDRAQGVRVLTDVAALFPNDPDVLRMAARRLHRLGAQDLAITLFQRLLAMAPGDPLNYRDLALALAGEGERLAVINTPASRAAALANYTRAIELLQTVGHRIWPNARGIQVIAMTECGGIRQKVRALDPDTRTTLESPFDGTLDMDLRIVLSWDTNARMDLSIVEPSGEEAYSSNPSTIGGLLFDECNDGYGPEEYCLRRRIPGRYIIRATGITGPTRIGPTTIEATVITNFGRPTESRRVMSVLLNGSRNTIEIGNVMLAAD